MNRISTVLLDADGVINTGKLMDLQKEFDISAERMQPFFRDAFPDCLIGKADLRERLTPYLAEWGWTGTVDELLQEWFKQGHVIHSMVEATVRQLRAMDIPVHLATNQEAYRAAYMRDHMGYGALFTAMHPSCEIGHVKPAREFFAAVHRRIGSPDPSSVLFWDDMQKNVDAARDYGFKSHLFTSEEEFMNTMKNYFVI